MGLPGSLIDPALVAELAAARPEEPVGALILLHGERRALAGGEVADPSAPASELAELIVAARSGRSPAPEWQVELYPELGALYVRAPAALLARLLADPGVASATVPDQGP